MPILNFYLSKTLINTFKIITKGMLKISLNLLNYLINEKEHDRSKKIVNSITEDDVKQTCYKLSLEIKSVISFQKVYQHSKLMRHKGRYYIACLSSFTYHHHLFKRVYENDILKYFLPFTTLFIVEPFYIDIFNVKYYYARGESISWIFFNNDVIFDIEILYNRHDMQSHIGLLREFVSILKFNLQNLLIQNFFNSAHINHINEDVLQKLKWYKTHLFRNNTIVNIDEELFKKNIIEWLTYILFTFNKNFYHHIFFFRILLSFNIRPKNSIIDIFRILEIILGKTIHVIDFKKNNTSNIIFKRLKDDQVFKDSVKGIIYLKKNTICAYNELDKMIYIPCYTTNYKYMIDLNTRYIYLELLHLDHHYLEHHLKKYLPINKTIQLSLRRSISIDHLLCMIFIIKFLQKYKVLIDIINFLDIDTALEKIYKIDINLTILKDELSLTWSNIDVIQLLKDHYFNVDALKNNNLYCIKPPYFKYHIKDEYDLYSELIWIIHPNKIFLYNKINKISWNIDSTVHYDINLRTKKIHELKRILAFMNLKEWITNMLIAWNNVWAFQGTCITLMSVRKNNIIWPNLYSSYNDTSYTNSFEIGNVFYLDKNILIKRTSLLICIDVKHYPSSIDEQSNFIKNIKLSFGVNYQHHLNLIKFKYILHKLIHQYIFFYVKSDHIILIKNIKDVHIGTLYTNKWLFICELFDINHVINEAKYVVLYQESSIHFTYKLDHSKVKIEHIIKKIDDHIYVYGLSTIDIYWWNIYTYITFDIKVNINHKNQVLLFLNKL